MSKISVLTPQQANSLSIYREKWQSISFCTEPILRPRAVRAIEEVYKQAANLKMPEVYFFDSPFGVANLSFLDKVYPSENWENSRKLNNLMRRTERRLLRELMGMSFFGEIVLPSINVMEPQLDICLWRELESQLRFDSSSHGLIAASLKDSERASSIWRTAKSNQKERLKNLWCLLASGLVTPETNCSICCILDFCLSELHCNPNENTWEVLKNFTTACGWTFFFKDFCLTCNRPFKIILDEQMQPHAENEAAIQFRDGFQIFANRGELTSAEKV